MHAGRQAGASKQTNKSGLLRARGSRRKTSSHMSPSFTGTSSKDSRVCGPPVGPDQSMGSGHPVIRGISHPEASTARHGRTHGPYLLVRVHVRPEHDRVQSCAIALRSPASERSSDLKRYSPDIHPEAVRSGGGRTDGRLPSFLPSSLPLACLFACLFVCACGRASP